MMLPEALTIERIAAHATGATVHGDGTATVTDLAYDSRDVGPGVLLFCRRGTRHDGHEFAAAAVSSGAAGLVVERLLPLDVPQIVVDDVARQMGPMASHAFGEPSVALRLVGVTGTNGKTTTSYLIERCFAAAGYRTGLIGTVETHLAGEVEPAGRTTPESLDVQRLLARMVAAGVQGAAMEVSSHGLALHRVDGTRFACAVFTNLTQDHLDFHGTMEAYFQAKAALFVPEFTTRAAVNADDAAGTRILEQARSNGLETTAFSMEGAADVFAEDVRMDASGSTFRCVVRGEPVDVRIRLAGPFNVANALAAMAAATAAGVAPDVAAAGIASLPGVPGRFEPVEAGQPFTVLVDYAHTPDSVERVLRAARRICTGRLTVVVGCGGDRDRTKRPLMGEAAASLADRAILTSDNPRSEDPLAILAAMEEGARRSGRSYDVEPDRRAAIRMAVASARDGDVVVIAGKGHESGQEFADRTIPFDDRAVAREELTRA